METKPTALERQFALESAKALLHKQNGTLTFPIQGGSMWPTLRHHDNIIVESAPVYHIGDILLFDDGERLIIHRLIRRDACQFWTKGDNQRQTDAPIEAHHILGHATVVIRHKRHILIRPKRQRIFRHALQYSWLVTALRRRLVR